MLADYYSVFDMNEPQPKVYIAAQNNEMGQSNNDEQRNILKIVVFVAAVLMLLACICLCSRKVKRGKSITLPENTSLI